MMLCQTDRLPFKSHLRTLSVLVFHLLLTHFCRGQSQLIGSSQPIVATLGDDIILPCHLDPAVDATGLTLEWTRPDLNPRFVHVWRDGVELVGKKHKSFEGRTSLFISELKHGNTSLKLSEVKLSDEGTYRCFFPGVEKQSFVQLVVASGVVSSPVIRLAGLDRDRGGVVLQCESKGWYPEPEVFWLDGEGNLLSAGPPETVKGPDKLYTVSSRVTVEKRHSNNFTCRVQQNNTNQTRETEIYIPDDFFMSPSNSALIGLAVSLAVCIMFIFAAVSFVWRQNIMKKKWSYMDKTERGENKNLSKSKDTEMQPLTAEGKQGELPTITQNNSKNNKGKKEKKTKCKHSLKEQLQEQQQGREEAEKRVNTMKQELETMKKKVEIMELNEQHQRQERDLQTLNENLETKKKELMTIQNSQSRFLWGSSKEHQKRKEEAEKDVEKLKEELEAKEKELKATIKEIEEKQAKVHQLCDDNPRREMDPQRLTEELETNSKEFDGTQTDAKRQLLDEQQRGEKAEKEVETLKKELETKMNEEKQKRDNNVKGLANQKDQEEKELKEIEIKWRETFQELQKTREQLKNTSAELRNLEKELEKSKLQVLGLQDSQKQSQEDDNTSAACQGSVRGRVYVEVDQDGKCVLLKNISNEDQPLGCWELQIQVDNKQPIIYTFLPSFTLKAGETVTIWPSNSGVEHSPPLNLVLWKSWGPADELLVTLLRFSGEEMAKMKVRSTKEANCAH